MFSLVNPFIFSLNFFPFSLLTFSLIEERRSIDICLTFFLLARQHFFDREIVEGDREVKSSIDNLIEFIRIINVVSALSTRQICLSIFIDCSQEFSRNETSTLFMDFVYDSKFSFSFIATFFFVRQLLLIEKLCRR